MPSSAPLPHKRLGQHFLIDHNIVRKILATAAIGPEETVLEIGPGRGILTESLCREAKRVIAVEVDARLVVYLRETLTHCPNLELREADALTFPYDTLPPRTVIVANLPYNISSPLLFAFFEARDRLDRMVLMLQVEVARRLVASPGSEEYGILSVLARYWTEPSIVFSVSPHCFRPKPEVGSAVVRLIVRRTPPLAVSDEALFIRVVRAAFAHRRKTLVNSLRDEGFDPHQVTQALERAHITSSRRAETLSLEDFGGLANALAQTAGR
ncbi:16S rRNA (adenine(1518)-N(6)/adenine(1519)-N(6))-dimethyltransferase RsmA [Candidatus Nitrospira bockiana]